MRQIGQRVDQVRHVEADLDRIAAVVDLEFFLGLFLLGVAIEIGFNVTYLIDALSNMSVEMIKMELQDTNSSALITVPEQTGFKYVVMPMRI